MFFYLSNHLRGPAAAAGARTWHQCRNSPSRVRIAVVIPDIDPVSATRVEDRHYAGLDFSRIEVIRLPSATLDRNSKLSRAWYYLALTYRQWLAGMRIRKPEAVISMSLPLSMLIVARLVSWMRRVPLYVDVRDLPFDVAREVGYAKSSVWTGLAARLEAAIVRSADIAFTVSPRFKAALEKRGCRRVIFNPIGFDNFGTTSADPRFSRAGLESLFAPAQVKFLVVAAGTLGHVTEVASLLEAAARLGRRSDIGFLLAGDGQNLALYRQQVARSGANVRFLGRVSKAAIAEICRNADAAYYGSAGGYFTNAMLGNKIFDYMGAGLPVIYHGPDSAVRDIVVPAGCALVSEAGQVDGLVGDILRLADDVSLRRGLGERAGDEIRAKYLAEGSAREFWSVVLGRPDRAEPVRSERAGPSGPGDDVAGAQTRCDWTLAFLVHDARSGSTLLSDMLTRRLNGIYVTPEISFIRLLKLAGRRGRPVRRRGLAARIVSDNLLRNLGIGADELHRLLAGMPESIPASGVIRSILGAHVGRVAMADPSCVVVKHGIHVRVWREIAAAFGQGARFIHIHRDPRAVVNSKMRTIRPYVKGESLAWYGPLLGAWRWRSYSMQMRAAQASGVPVLDVPYEALLEDPDAQIRRIAAFLGITVRGQSDLPAADYRIPVAEREMHALVQSGRVHRERVGAWSTELSTHDLDVIEAVAAGEMRARGYQPSRALSAAKRAARIVAAVPGTAKAVIARAWRQLARRGNDAPGPVGAPPVRRE